jgi:hypothetical protein
MNETNNKSNSWHSSNVLQLFIVATIIMTGFMVMIKIGKVMLQDMREMGLK